MIVAKAWEVGMGNGDLLLKGSKLSFKMNKLWGSIIQYGDNIVLHTRKLVTN